MLSKVSLSELGEREKKKKLGLHCVSEHKIFLVAVQLLLSTRVDFMVRVVIHHRCLFNFNVVFLAFWSNLFILGLV